MNKKMKLSTKLITLLLLVGLLPLLSISIFTYLQSNNMLTKAIYDGIAIYADQTDSLLEGYFEERISDVSLISQKADIKEFLLLAEKDINSEATQAQRRHVFEDILLTAKTYGYLTINIVNKKGIVIEDSSGKEVGTDMSKTDYVTDALKGNVHVSEMFYEDVSKEIIMSIAGPVKNNSGEIIGAIVCDIKQKTVEDKTLYGIEKIGKTGDAYLIDVNGVLSTNSKFTKKEDVMKKKIDTDMTRELIKSISQKDLKIVLEKEYSDYRGEQVLGFGLVSKLGTEYYGLVIEVDSAEALGGVTLLRTIMLLALLIVAFVVTLIAIFFARSITKPIQRAIDIIGESSEQVASGSQQVSVASQRLAEGSAEQASSLEETSSSIEELTSMTQKNADNSLEANKMMEQTSQIATRANNSMKEMKRAMEDITSSSEKTAKIIKVIDEIAFQTNLLALNAAVEAARAGEAGMGFAVVADEVRNLAQRSAEAAKNTADLIEGSIKNIKEGYVLSQSTEKEFVEVGEIIIKVKELIAEVATASKEQAQGLRQVNTAVAEMDKVVQKNAASSEESASASEEMSSQAQALLAVVTELVAIVGQAGESTKVTLRHNDPNHSDAHHFINTQHNVHTIGNNGGKHTGIVPIHHSPEHKTLVSSHSGKGSHEHFPMHEEVSDHDFKDFK